MFVSKIKKMRICEGQNEILLIKMFVPSSEEYLKISSFYDDISESAMRTCAEILGDRARVDYTDSRENGVRFTRYVYSLFCDLLYLDPHIAIIGLKSELKRGTSLLDCASDTQWWELESEKMIPAKIALKEYFEWQRSFGKIRRKTHVTLEGMGVFADIRGKSRHLGDLTEKGQ